MKNPYAVETVRIKKCVNEAPDVRTLLLDKKMDFNPGQFVMVSLLGFGESAISISSYPDLQITFRRAGNVTNALFEKCTGDEIGLRGPFGKPYPLNEIAGKHILLASGGCGIAPIRSLLKYYLLNENSFSGASLFFGARNPSMILYKNELKEWRKSFEVHLTVDQANSEWEGNVGVVSLLLEEFKLPANAAAVVCGPSIMIKSVAETLGKKGMPESDMIVSLERNMRCGLGKCGRCNIAEKFVCLDGPNFRWSDIKWRV
ncbi:FAD/NAD(P)-binding protein [Candidatus Micrarchaeota archaeon]|nr:FAD/NAD(P)-binding protein [Candidatus Micrarchaeota archaeon]